MYTSLSHEEYRKLSARTVSNNFWVDKDTNLVTERGRIQELHMVMGLVTEMQELMLAVLKPDGEERIVNIGEELADCFWYLAGLERLFGYDISNVQPHLAVHTPMNLVTDLLVDSIELLDYYKKEFFYNKPLAIAKLVSKMNHIAANLETLAIDFGHNTSVLKAKNINKLLVRYPEKFTELNAQVRDTDKEYQVLK